MACCAQGVVVVPQQYAWVVERFGRFHSILDPGLNFLIPGVHRIRYVYSLKEEALSVPSQALFPTRTLTPPSPRHPPLLRRDESQSVVLLLPQTAITRDNVNIAIDGVLYIKIVDAYKAAYGVEDPHYAITQLARAEPPPDTARAST